MLDAECHFCSFCLVRLVDSDWYQFDSIRTHSQLHRMYAFHIYVPNLCLCQDGQQLTLDDEDVALNNKSRNSIHVVFETIDALRAPTSTPEVAEYVPKSLSYSCMHMALTDINPPPCADGCPPAPLLAREIVLGRLFLESNEDKSDLSSWHLNSSQEQAIRRALARHFQLLHGPPGTGKTRTAAVLMTLFAQRNLGSRCAILFGAPTNRAVDCALMYTNQLCESYFAERLRSFSACNWQFANVFVVFFSQHFLQIFGRSITPTNVSSSPRNTLHVGK